MSYDLLPVDKEKLPSVSIDPECIRIAPHCLYSDEWPGDFRHKVLALEIGNARKRIEVAVDCGGFHDDLLDKFPDTYDSDKKQFKCSDVEVYAAKLGLLEHEGGHALVVNGHSASGIRTIQSDIGLVIARQMSEVMRGYKSDDSRRRKENRQWTDVDWSWIGTAPSVSDDLVLQELG